MFSLYSFVNSPTPWLVFEIEKQSIQYNWDKICIGRKAKTKQQLLETYGHLSFDMLYLYGKI